MTGNTLGALKAKLTKHSNELVRKYQEEERNKKIKEIKKNKQRWIRAINKLKILDPYFDSWYESPEIPDIIKWTGEEFENVLKILRSRLREIKKEIK